MADRRPAPGPRRDAEIPAPIALEDDYPEQAQDASAYAGAAGLADPTGLAALGQALLSAASSTATKADQEAALAALAEALPKLDFKRFPELRDNPVIEAFLEQLSEQRAEATDVPPGTIIDKGKPTERIKDWTERDLAKSGMQIVSFTPMETIPVVWNGLRCQLIAGEEITTYKCFKDVYDEHIFETRFADAHKRWLFQQQQGLPHPDMANPDGIRARATGSGGTLAIGAGLFEPGAGEAAEGKEAAGGEA